MSRHVLAPHALVLLAGLTWPAFAFAQPAPAETTPTEPAPVEQPAPAQPAPIEQSAPVEQPAPAPRPHRSYEGEPIGGGYVEGGLPTNDHYESPQHFAFEIKGGPYSPNIDATPGLTGMPFSELFNSRYGKYAGKRPPGKPLITLEFDWQFWHGFGSLGVGGSVGYSGRKTHSFQYTMTASGDESCQLADCVRSNDTTQLNIMPFTLELVYRFDVLAKRWRVPLVPYLKGGLGYYFWFIQRGSGSLAYAKDNPKDKAIGGTFGLVAHPGLAFLLDVLEPSAARTMDAETGINHIYAFAELNYAWITGFNSKSKMVFSDLTWNVGLAFEF